MYRDQIPALEDRYLAALQQLRRREDTIYLKDKEMMDLFPKIQTAMENDRRNEKNNPYSR